MTIVRCYPSAYSDPGTPPDNWHYPQNVTGVEDNNCTHKHCQTTGHFVLNLTAFKDVNGNPFNIPSNAVLDKITVTAKGTETQCDTNHGLDVWYQPKPGVSFMTANVTASYLCADAKWMQLIILTASDIIFYGITPADFNNETFTIWLDFVVNVLGDGHVGYVDAVYIEVEYHLPSALASKRLLVGVGL